MSELHQIFLAYMRLPARSPERETERSDISENACYAALALLVLQATLLKEKRVRDAALHQSFARDQQQGRCPLALRESHPTHRAWQ